MSDSGQKQETTSDPWGGIQPYLQTGYSRAQRDILGRKQQFFPGETYVGFAPETEQALALQTQRAQDNPLLGLGQEQTAATLRGDYLGQNPYFADIQDAVMSSVMPQVDSQFGMASGRFGSPAHAEALGRGVSRGMAPYLFGEYGAERGRQMQAAGMAPGMAQADYFDIGQLANVGAAREGLEGRALQDEINRFNFYQQEPVNRLQNYMGILGGSAPLIAGSGTTQATTRQPFNPLTFGLGAATTLGGAALGNPFAFF